MLDPFAGTGTTCAVAKRMGRRWLGIDSNQTFLVAAAQRIDAATEPMTDAVRRARAKQYRDLAECRANSVAAKQIEKGMRVSYFLAQNSRFFGLRLAYSNRKTPAGATGGVVLT